jgi:dipeptide/tripeptide permease
MFLRLPFAFSNNLQHLVLVLNTIVLVVSLVVVELIYSEAPKEKRKHLVYFYPLFIVLAGLLLYAIYTQMGKK